ncbi:cold-regulated protein 27 isoform X1 [Raphanus sativus]|uniref:Cold-regulated protein 27 isoform X1 n=1 Tax=Raphanus sativus TaxID=3726 RepID=A0A6J0L3W4_RAPSA|nr:cold-regulated protein 27 isoform X1 [Raphanus sativus]
MYSSGKECMPTEWTDEKHSLYLKSMEASFVDQLYSSLGWSLMSKENVGGNPSEEQFKVFRDGFWQKMNVRQPHEYRVKGRRQGGGSNHEFLKSPWIKHYRTIGEVSDQNFANEVTKGENSGSSKKIKTVMNGSSSTDQVVPLRKTPADMT